MIVNRFSALIGLGLVLYALITILALIGCCMSGDTLLTIAGVANTILNGVMIVGVYNFFKEK